MPPKEVDKVGGVECDICELVVKVVEQYAVDNSTEVCLFIVLFLLFVYLSQAEVKQALEEFCESLPSAVSGTVSFLFNFFVVVNCSSIVFRSC